MKKPQDMIGFPVAPQFHCNRTSPICFFRPHLSILAVVLLNAGHCWGTDEIEFTNREALESASSDNGTITLEWSSPEKVSVRIEQSSTDDFASPLVRYEGSGRSMVLSGLAEGSHFFRVGKPDGSGWSAPLEVSVEFFPRDRLWLLLFLGGVVVLMTAGAIVTGYLSNRKGEHQ